MNENDIFRENMLRALAESGMTEATLSVKAGLNRRAITDIREGRVTSPRISTVFAIARALGKDPAELMGLGARHRLNDELARFLSAYSEEDQLLFLAALAALPRAPV
jgi:transcriptional regulator with XRE-family HTH domain